VKPVLLELGGLQIQSYGISKALAVLAAGWLLKRELARRGHNPQWAFSFALAGAIGGFAGAKLYYLAEVAGGGLSPHDFGGSGFTWYGGLIGGALAVLVIARRRRIALGEIAAMTAIPLAVAYGIGRLGCLLAGDGTYGAPTDLPWAMRFPEGTVPTTDLVHPAPLYEALASFVIAAALWWLRDRVRPVALFGASAVFMGASRFLVEIIRINDTVAIGLTAAQLWSLALIGLGTAVLIRDRLMNRQPTHAVTQPA